MYTSYVLTDACRDRLMISFAPLYPEVVAHHITCEFGVKKKHPLPVADAVLRVVGYKSSGDGIEALVVSVNGSVERPDGKVYHITWSLDRAKYKPQDSNNLLEDKMYHPVNELFVEGVPTISK